MNSFNRTEIKICLGKLDYLSLALKNLSNTNGNSNDSEFRQNVAEISRLLEGQVGRLHGSWQRLQDSLSQKPADRE